MNEPISPDTRLLLKVLTRNRAENNRQIHKVLLEQQTLRAKIERLERGFPNDDPASHRRFHENVIEWYDLRNRIFREALINIAKVGTIGGIGWLGWLVWQYLKFNLKS